jgi:spore coat protein H
MDTYARAALGLILAGCSGGPVLGWDEGQAETPAGQEVLLPQGPPLSQPALPQQPPEASPARPVGWPALQDEVPAYQLWISEEHLALLEQRISDRQLLVPARFGHDGRTWEVQVRYRGRHTRYLPKRSFQVRFSAEDPFWGNVRRLELLASWKDGGLLTEKIAYDLAAAAGLRVPNVRHVNLDLNGRYHGVMVEIEALKKAFLRAHDYDLDSDIYRCGMFDCELRTPPQEPHQQPWIKRTNEDESWDPLWRLLEFVNRTPPEQLAQTLEQHLELDDYLTWLAVDAAIANDTVGDSRSYLIREKRTKKWSYVPWDLNNARLLYNRTNSVDQWPKYKHPLMNFTLYDPIVYELADKRLALGYQDMKPTWSTLNTRIVDDPVLRARLVEKIRWLLDTYFREEEVGPRAEAVAALIAPDLARDPWVDPAFVARSADFIRWHVRIRRAWLLENLHILEARGTPPLRIRGLQLEASGAAMVELENPGGSPVRLGGMYLTGNARVPTQARLPTRSLGPGETVRLSERELSSGSGGGFRLDPTRPELAVFAEDGRTALDAVFLGPLGPGEGWKRAAP